MFPKTAQNSLSVLKHEKESYREKIIYLFPARGIGIIAFCLSMFPWLRHISYVGYNPLKYFHETSHILSLMCRDQESQLAFSNLEYFHETSHILSLMCRNQESQLAFSNFEFCQS